MMRKNFFYLIFTSFLIFLILISNIPTTSRINQMNQNSINYPESSASLEGSENILITKINREANFSGYGLVNIIDSMEVKNSNSYPITSIFIGIPMKDQLNLIFYEAYGKEKNSLLTERSYMVMNEFEMIAIYFDTPLLPHQVTQINFIQSYKDLLLYSVITSPYGYILTQYINFTGRVYPILPYRAEGSITSIFRFPKTSSVIEKDWGTENSASHSITYDLNTTGHAYLKPFLENIGTKENISISLSETSLTKMEVKELNREIFISPWSVIKVREDFLIQNIGVKDINSFSLSIPGLAKSVSVYDDLGEIFGVTLEEDTDINNTTSSYKNLEIDFLENRVRIVPNSKIRFTLQYNLPFENYFSLNWFQESIQINILTTKYEFLGREQTIKIIVEGSNKIVSYTSPPKIIEFTQSSMIMTYESDYVSPLEKNIIQFTYTLDYFDLLLRPVVFTLLIIAITSAFVLITKTRKKEEVLTVIERAKIPIKEIKEYCSLFEEKNTLIFEIRQAESDKKRKKLAKKKYVNILDKNTSKIEEIMRELAPYKNEIMETSVSLENLVKKIDLLDAERISIKDSLNLLEIRYKQGRLPSKSAYHKLSNDFLKRQKKIDRSIDKSIQQLRSYLI